MRLVLKIFGIILILAVIIFVGKDYIVNGYVNDLLRKEFQKGSVVEKTSLWLNSLELKGVSILGDGFKLNVDKIIFDIKYTDSFKPVIKGVRVNNSRLKIYDTDKTKKVLEDKISLLKMGPNNKEPKIKKEPFNVDIANMGIEIDKEGLVPLKATFSFKGSISQGRVTELQNIEIDECIIQSNERKVSFTLYKIQEDNYTLHIDKFKVKENEIEDISIGLSLGLEQTEIRNVKTDILGDSASLKGVIDYKDYNDICILFILKEVSLNGAKNLFMEKQKVLFQGRFDGKVYFCLKGKEIVDIDVNLYNNTGGRIDVKERRAVSFLKKRMDESSYNTLMNSLQDYKYNRGKIKISQDNDVIIVNMFFSSPVLGERNLTVNFHDFIDVSN